MAKILDIFDPSLLLNKAMLWNGPPSTVHVDYGWPGTRKLAFLRIQRSTPSGPFSVKAKSHFSCVLSPLFFGLHPQSYLLNISSLLHILHKVRIFNNIILLKAWIQTDERTMTRSEQLVVRDGIIRSGCEALNPLWDGKLTTCQKNSIQI